MSEGSEQQSPAPAPDTGAGQARDNPAATVRLSPVRNFAQRLFGRLLRLCLRTALTLLLLFTTYVTAGRLLMPALTTQKQDIEVRLTRMLGTPVAIGTIEGDWFRFSPGFALTNLVLQLDPADPQSRIVLAEAEITLDLWKTLLQGQPVLDLIEVNRIELALDQLADGRWTLRGLAPGARDYKDMILDLLLETPLITINESAVRVRLQDGRQLQLQSVFVQLQNQGREHELRLQFRPGAHNNPVLVHVGLNGNPRTRFTASMWVGASSLELHEQLVPFLPEDWQLDSITAAAELWADFDQTGLHSISGIVSNVGVHGTLGKSSGQSAGESAGESAVPIDLANAGWRFSARRDPQRPQQATLWQLDLHELAFDWNSTPWNIPLLQLRLPLDSSAVWQLRADTLDMQMLAGIAATLPLPELALSAAQTLAPSGVLRHVLLESDRSGNYPDVFSLKGNFERLAVEAWRGAPAGNGFSGYVETSAHSGFVEVDAGNVSLYFPTLFREPWNYQHINSRVNWSLFDNGFRIGSTPILVSNEFLQGKVQFEVNNERLEDNKRSSTLSLMVGMEYMDLAIHSAYLPTLPRIAPTIAWLDTALQGGRIVNSGFILRTPIGRNTEPDSVTHASWYEVEQGVFKFLPEWPALEIASAHVAVHDQSTQVTSSAARIAGIEVQQVQAQVNPLAGGGSWLDVAVQAHTDTDSGIGFLRTSPLHETIGTALDNWKASGSLDLRVALGIPLGDTLKTQEIAVDVQSSDSTLRLNDQLLDISALNGLISYTHDKGLQAEQLSARIFDADVELGIVTLPNGPAGAKTIRVSSAGHAAIKALKAWEGQAAFVRNLLEFTEGELDYTARLDIPGKGSGEQTHLRITSSLLGVTSHFPEPLRKSPDQTAKLQLDMHFNGSSHELQLSYSDWLSGALVLDEAGIDRGQLYFGMLNQTFNIRQTDEAASGLLINGDLSAFDYEEWSSVADRIAENTTGGKGLKDYLRLIDVDIGRLHLLDQEFEDINVQVQYREGAWQIYGQNALLAGTIMLPDDTAQPWDVKLDYLRFPPKEIPEPPPEGEEAPPVEEIDLLEKVDPSGLPAFMFQTAELSIGENNLGSWKFTLTPDQDGAVITDFLMEEEASIITGMTGDEDPEAPVTQPEITEETIGARIDWRYRNELHSSDFDGVFTAGDLSKVMPKWGHNANVVSSNARFIGGLAWPGSPLAFSLKKASGELNLAINNGRFVDISSGSSRLLGAFNFDALVRRLELDFSDLYQRGFSFDTIRGTLDFTDGVVHTRIPLIIDGPSSRLNINGEISLAEETIAADMQVRIPLSENISLLAGLLGAWPIALSTYIAGKIFADQVEDFTTIIYRLEGPWDNPQAGFEAPEEAVTP